MNKATIIKYSQTGIRVLLGLLLVIAGYLKVQDDTALFQSVAYIMWLPLWFKSFLIDTLPYIEIIVGLLLIVKIRLLDKIVLPVAGLIYLSFFIFAIYGLSTGIEGDCGCFGDPESGSILAAVLGSEFGWQMVFRNGLFLAMAGFLFWRPGFENDTEPEEEKETSSM